MIISLYAGGMTVRDIQHHLATTLGVDMSPDTISTITDAVLDEVMIWQNRQLDEFYPVIFLDALRVKIRDGHRVVNKACYMAVGVDMDGIKHILGLWIADNEGAAFWASVCADLANRGVQDVFIVCCDGLKRPAGGCGGNLAEFYGADLYCAPDSGCEPVGVLPGPQISLPRTA